MSTDSVEIVPDEQIMRLAEIVESSDDAINGMALDGTMDYLVKPINHKQFVESIRTLYMHSTLSRSPS
jgi:response regulator of citrate/malate metabolism